MLKPEEITALRTTISPMRFGTYLTAAGHDVNRAFELYLWNAQLGEAFHTPIQAVEVGLRNCVNRALSGEFTPNWWECQGLDVLLDQERKVDLTTVTRRIRNRDLELCTDQIVAGLSFGFWVGMLDGRYNPPIWSRQLRKAFPDFPASRSRKSLALAAAKVAGLRNRISHHEPLIGRNISQDYSNVMTLLQWICPTTAAWIRPHSRVPAILRQRP